jgi:hypothetical protein
MRKSSLGGLRKHKLPLNWIFLFSFLHLPITLYGLNIKIQAVNVWHALYELYFAVLNKKFKI